MKIDKKIHHSICHTNLDLYRMYTYIVVFECILCFQFRFRFWLIIKLFTDILVNLTIVLIFVHGSLNLWIIRAKENVYLPIEMALNPYCSPFLILFAELCRHCTWKYYYIINMYLLEISRKSLCKLWAFRAQGSAKDSVGPFKIYIIRNSDGSHL